jgi:branched-chain amino acid transport system permease protein
MPNFLANLRTAIPTLMLFVILVALPQVRLRAGRLVGARVPRVPSARTAGLAAVIFIAVAYLVAGQLSGVNLNTASQALSVGIIGLSLVLLTGYGGQISLCQYTFVGLGAFVFGKVASNGNILGLIVVAAVAAVVGALVALPALRLQGLYLALSTLAFARLADALFFINPHVLSRDSLRIHRLRLPGVSFNGGQGNVLLLAIAFALLGLFVLAIRRGPFGRLLGAMRDSPAACATLGVDLTLTKLGVFALSAAMAGVGGALYGGSQGSVTSSNFLYIQSLFLLLIITIGGINTVSGALLGGIFLAMFPVIAGHLPARFTQLAYLGTGFAAISLGRNPSGVVGQLSAASDRWRARLGQPRPQPATAPSPATAQ